MDRGNPLDDEEWYVVFINQPSTRFKRVVKPSDAAIVECIDSMELQMMGIKPE